MSYGADFANADPANAPLDPTIFIGATPFFWGAILLGLAAVLLLGWYLGAQSSSRRADAAQAIWKAIHDAARSAMGADDNALKGRAEALRRVVEARLGKTLTLAKGLSRQVKKLDDALAGRGPAHPGGGHGHGHTPDHGGHGPDGGHGEPAPSGGGGGGGGGAATANITIVTGGAPDQTHSTGGGHGPAHDPHEMRDLTQREQTGALRLAVAAFNQHWREESLRVGELRAAHAELSNPGPRPDAAHAAQGKVHGTRAKH